MKKLYRNFHKRKYESLGYLKFKPVNRFMSAGNEIQVCCTKYKGIGITERTFFPYISFKGPITWYVLDLVLPMTISPPNGIMNDNYYTDEGFGMPEFDKLEDACNFIKQYIND